MEWNWSRISIGRALGIGVGKMRDTEGQRPEETGYADEKKQIPELAKSTHNQHTHCSRKEDDCHKNITYCLGTYAHATNAHRLLLCMKKRIRMYIGNNREEYIMNRNSRSSFTDASQATFTYAY